MIGWYVHHQGLGHLHRLESVLPHLAEPVTVLSSLPRPAGWSGEWVQLARDDESLEPRDVDAHGVLHWTPRHDPGLARRTAQVTSWIAEVAPRLVVVDVSVEISLVARLAGVPVVVVAQPGDRTDRAHRTAYDLADTLVAPWPADVPLAWPAAWRDKTVHCGSIGGFDGQPRLRRGPGVGRRGLLLWGSGGTGLTEGAVRSLQASTPGWTWTVAGGSSRLGREELWRALCSVDVVVTHGGQNAVAEVAAARAPAVVVSDPRPFGEQLATVIAVERLGLAVGLPSWPEASRWPQLLDEAVRIGGEGWARWSFGDGAARAARAVDATAQRLAGA